MCLFCIVCLLIQPLAAVYQYMMMTMLLLCVIAVSAVSSSCLKQYLAVASLSSKALCTTDMTSAVIDIYNCDVMMKCVVSSLCRKSLAMLHV